MHNEKPALTVAANPPHGNKFLAGFLSALGFDGNAPSPIAMWVQESVFTSELRALRFLCFTVEAGIQPKDANRHTL